MKNVLTLLAATAAVGLASSAFAADESAQVKSKVDYKKNGGYEATRSSEHTTGNTTHATESKVDLSVDSDGKAEKTIKAESSTDPKGLMNKKKDTSETKIEEKERGGYKQTTTRKHSDKDGTSTTVKATTDTNVDKDGNVKTTAETEKTVDPKGLLNETTTKTKVKAENGKVVESTTSH